MNQAHPRATRPSGRTLAATRWAPAPDVFGPQGWNGAALDAQYNNRVLVPDFAAYLQRWAEQSARVRAQQPAALDVAYGSGPGETLDVFPATTSVYPAGRAPVLVFIHGGYWRSLDKADHSFVAPAYTAQGACVVVPNYALCPAVTVPEIAKQMVAALRWVRQNIRLYGGDPDRVLVAGHSAGGHLAALLLACNWPEADARLPARWVRRGLSISGLHDLEPMRHTPFLAPFLRLDEADALRASPGWMPAPTGGRLVAVAGGDESAEFHRQAAWLQARWGKRVVPVCERLPGLNHFSVLDAFATPGQRLHQLANDLLARA